MKKFFYIVFLVFFLGGTLLAFAQDEDTYTIKGEIEKVESNEGYIVVDGEKINVANDILEESEFMAGDMVEVTVEKTDTGLDLVDYEYAFYGGEESEEETVPFDFESESFNFEGEEGAEE